MHFFVFGDFISGIIFKVWPLTFRSFCDILAFVRPLIYSTKRNSTVNSLRPRQYGRHFPDDILKCIFLNENISISINISLKFVPKGRINNIPALVQIMAWHRQPGDEALSEPMMIILLTHIYVTRPQWVNYLIESVNITSM